MHISLEARNIEIKGLNLSDAITKFLISLDAPKELAYLFESPFYFYTSGAPEQPASWPHLEHRTLLPLWEHHQQVFTVDLAKTTPEYLSFYLEKPDEPTIYGSSALLPIFHMLELHLWEYGGSSKEANEVYAFSNQLGIPHLTELRILLDDFINCSDEQIDEYRKLLITYA